MLCRRCVSSEGVSWNKKELKMQNEEWRVRNEGWNTGESYDFRLLWGPTGTCPVCPSLIRWEFTGETHSKKILLQGQLVWTKSCWLSLLGRVTFRFLRSRTTLHINLDSHTDISKISERHWWQLLLQSLAFPPIPQRLCCKHSQVYCRQTNIPEELPYGKLQIPAVQTTFFLGSSHTTRCSSSLLPYPVWVMPHAVNLLVEEWLQKIWPPVEYRQRFDG